MPAKTHDAIRYDRSEAIPVASDTTDPVGWPARSRGLWGSMGSHSRTAVASHTFAHSVSSLRSLINVFVPRHSLKNERFLKMNQQQQQQTGNCILMPSAEIGTVNGGTRHACSKDNGERENTRKLTNALHHVHHQATRPCAAQRTRTQSLAALPSVPGMS